MHTDAISLSFSLSLSLSLSLLSLSLSLISLSLSQGFPLIFHGVAGTDEREANCPSAYNMAEVEVLKEYLKAVITHLHKNSVTKIGPKEIGIITPYSKQVSMFSLQPVDMLIDLDTEIRFVAIQRQNIYFRDTFGVWWPSETPS